MKILLGILLVFLLVSTSVHAQEQKEHAIDKALGACIDKDPSTAGMVECIGRAYEMWDKELNRVYNELMKRSGAQSKQALKAAQLEWIKYRDAEFKLIDSIYTGLEGTMYIPMRADNRMRVVKARALELNDHLELLKEHSQ